MQAQARLGKPLRDQPAKNAALFALPEVADSIFVGLAALAGDDKHVPKSVRLAASQEAAQNDVGILLPQAVKVEPRIDCIAASGDPFADTRIEGRMRRRRSGLALVRGNGRLRGVSRAI